MSKSNQFEENAKNLGSLSKKELVKKAKKFSESILCWQWR